MRISDWSSDVCSSDLELRAVRQAVNRTLTTFLVDDRQFAITSKRQTTTPRILDRRHIAIFQMTIGHRIEVRLLVELRRTADMEGTHGKLRARLTNGLRCDDAYGFTDVDRQIGRAHVRT